MSAVALINAQSDMTTAAQCYARSLLSEFAAECGISADVLNPFLTKNGLSNKLLANSGAGGDDEEYIDTENNMNLVVKPDVSSFAHVKVEMATKKEVQAHGFMWQYEIARNVYGATHEELKNECYTGKFDLPAELNRLDGRSKSIKTTGSLNAVCMADCLRVFDAVSSGTSFDMVVVYYVQDDTNNTKKLVSITEVDLTDSRELLFGSLTRSQIEELDTIVKSVPQKRKPTEEEYVKMYSLRNSLQMSSGAIRFDIKCNSTQSRLQCSFNHFQDFIAKNPSRIVAKSNTNEFRGGTISSQITSSRRVFKKKQIV